MAEILVKEGIPFITAFPGGGPQSPVSQIVNELSKRGVRTILPRTERGVINIADGYARISGKVGVCSLYEGPGVENAFPGVAQAGADGSPVLVLAGQAPRAMMAYDAANNDVDGTFLYLKTVKWLSRANVAEDIPYLLRRAFTNMRTGRPGPVYLELVFDTVTEELDDSVLSYAPVKGWRTGGDPKDVESAVKAFLTADRPLIYAGQGILYARAWDELKEFAELVQAPVMTTLNGKSSFPENHFLSVGGGGRSGIPDLQYFFNEADLVFGIGASFSKGPGAGMQRGTKYIQSVVEGTDVNKSQAVDYVVIGDAKLVLRQMIDEVKRQTNGNRREVNEQLIKEIKHAKEKWLRKWMPKLASDEVPINPYRLVRDMVDTLDPNTTIITHDAGWPREQLVPFWTATVPRGYLGWGHHSVLGFSVAATIGAKLAEPEKTCVCFTGDGAFGEGGIEFETAARYNIPILVVIPNNGGLGHYEMDTPTLNVLGGDYAKIAEAMGAYGERVENPEQIVPALERALKALESGQPALLDVICKREWANQESGFDARAPKSQV